MHTDLVANQSAALKALVTHPMVEGREHCTTWELIDELTFARFAQHAYMGDYKSEEPYRPPAPDTEEEAECKESQAAFDDIVFTVGANAKKVHKKTKAQNVDSEMPPTKRQNAWNDFLSRVYSHGVSKRHVVPKNQDPREGYKEVFLCHARLHSLAQYYDIGALTQLSLHKLHRTLCNFILHSERVTDVIDLVQFCFEDEGLSLLRDLVVAFCVCHFEKLWEHEAFREVFLGREELIILITESLVSTRLD